MEDVIFLLDIFEDIDTFLLILLRMVGFIAFMPLFSTQNIPATIRMLFAVAFSYMVFITGIYGEATYQFSDNLFGFAWVGVIEFLFGFFMAYVVNITFGLIFIIGHFMDEAIGFNMVNVMDPLSQMQVAVTGTLLYNLTIVTLIVTGGLNVILAAVFQSFESTPLGSPMIFGNEAITIHIMNTMINTFYMGIQIAMPIVGAGLIVNACLGILVKATPQMNIFVVGIPIRIMLGLIIFIFVIPAFGAVHDNIFNQALRTLLETIAFLTPWG